MLKDEQKTMADLKELSQSFDRGSAVVIVSADPKISVEPEDGSHCGWTDCC